MKGEWTHTICFTDWEKRNPGRRPLRMKSVEKESCCYCGKLTSDGIYVRDDPKIHE